MLTLRERLGSPRFFCGVRVGHIFSFQCCVNSFVCLRPVSSVPNVAIVSLDCPFFITPCFLWIVYSWLHLRFSLDCPFLITPSVFSNVYLIYYLFSNLQHFDQYHFNKRENICLKIFLNVYRSPTVRKVLVRFVLIILNFYVNHLYTFNC